MVRRGAVDGWLDLEHFRVWGVRGTCIRGCGAGNGKVARALAFVPGFGCLMWRSWCCGVR